MSNCLDIHIDFDDASWLNEDGTLDRFALKEELKRIVYIVTESWSVIDDIISTSTPAAPSGANSGKVEFKFKANDKSS